VRVAVAGLAEHRRGQAADEHHGHRGGQRDRRGDADRPDQQGTSLGEAANREIVAQELVALLVGSIGIAAAVPLTTAVAVALARRLPADALGDGGHGHAH